MRRLVRPFILTGIGLFALHISACSTGWLGEEKERPPLPGDRISVLDFENDLRPEQADSVAPFQRPPVTDMPAWPQAGGTPSHAPQHVALSDNKLTRAWKVSIGQGSQSNLPLTAQPVVAGESIFTLDTDGRVSSFATTDGTRRWRLDVRDPNEDDPVISGGIALDSGILYVTAGYDEVVAVDATKGEIKWRSAIPGPSRAAPTIVDGRVFVTTLGNTLIALNQADGAVLWEFSGLGQSTGLIGAASPAAIDDLIIPAFSSGEIYALRAGNGSVAWSDNLAGTVQLGGLTALSDIRGLPVVIDNVVYAISFGGKMAAIDLLTGARVWSRDISGAKTPWVAGNRVFIISAEGQIVAMDRASGKVVWVSQLARYKNKTDKANPIFWTGPILAGGRLMAFSTDGRMAEINPEDGTLVREGSTGEDIRLAPIVAGGTLYLLSEDGDLIAYR